MTEWIPCIFGAILICATGYGFYVKLQKEIAPGLDLHVKLMKEIKELRKHVEALEKMRLDHEILEHAKIDTDIKSLKARKYDEEFYDFFNYLKDFFKNEKDKPVTETIEEKDPIERLPLETPDETEKEQPFIDNEIQIKEILS